MSCGVDHRCGSDLLWHRLATVVPIRPLAWEPPHAISTALKGKKKTKKKKQNKNKTKKQTQKTKQKNPRLSHK